MDVTDQDVAMLLAIEDDDPVALREILKMGAEADTYCYDLNGIPAKSMIHIASEKGRLECLKALLDYGGSADASDRWGQTPIMYSIMAGRREITEYLLEKEPSLAKDSDHKGNTPLHCAVQAACIEDMKLIVSRGAELNRQTTRGVTPLMLACLEYSTTLVNYLIEAGADINMREYRNNSTALHLAVLTKHVDVVEILLQAGADPNIADRSGKIPLTNCILENIPVKQATGVAPIIDPNIQSMIFLLTQAGSNLNLTMCEYSHALICASFVGSAELVQFFIEQGSIPNMVFPSGVTPILAAVSRNQINVVKHLLYWNCEFQNRGRICRKRIDYYFDPFELAIFMKNWEIAKLLLFAGYQWKAGLVEKNEDLRDPLLACEEMAKWYTDYTRTTQSLQFYCIRTIRSCIGGNISQKLKSLKLPPFINNKILLNHLLSVDS
ncbi:serine/threonine-protein phosphatase 6 regulatory ankyrin repeat subunit C-like [Octopus vulgaris]|uniref:Serine/threonine-protein phosphatase 6 regulatory ankyrin repeat subunit C-like n=1 Tax=Octopus vulgaris TaxID=6645 RepID=A0AA36BMC0_OCTVU|nr:serine/threonine-protein phosphatase 6 regulatory ankyrin repeat subunit C-like [Octopus vulgaris]